MATLIECRDPLGRAVTLHDDRWYQYILIKQQPLKSSDVDHIRDTIERPDFIQADANFSDRESFYKQGVIRSRPRQLLKVIVGFEDGDAGQRGSVITAYLVFRPTAEELRLWPVTATSTTP